MKGNKIMNKYLTIDVGGTFVKYALIDEVLNITEKQIIATPQESLDEFIETIGEIYDHYHDVIKGMALSMPGIIDPQTGFCFTGGALKYIQNIPMIECLQKRCPTLISIGNDAKCAANAEVGFGSLKDVQDAVVIVLGTAVGGCLIKDKKVHTGKHFCAGEFSFVSTDINNYQDFSNTWWQKSGSIGLLKQYRQCSNTDEQLTGKEIFTKVLAGDENAIKALDLYTLDLAVQICNIQTIFDPEKIAIGGGISEQPLLFEMLEKNIKRILELTQAPIPLPQIVACQFKNDANLIGALYQFIKTK